MLITFFRIPTVNRITHGCLCHEQDSHMTQRYILTATEKIRLVGKLEADNKIELSVESLFAQSWEGLGSYTTCF